jgi:predicted ABC-type transport system involved in lysophospholipase L1 biosynthesis ATPase subunit
MARTIGPESAADGSAEAHRNSASILLRLDEVSKTYREGAIESSVLNAASLDVVRGEVTSLIGASGSGKSTLLGIIAGLMLPDSGLTVFDGSSITELDDNERAHLRANRIGVVLQSGNLIPFLTAQENVELAVQLAGGRHGARRAGELLSRLGLADRRDHLPRRLSGGEAQRVAVAMALINEPDLLLADEVTGELDSSSAAQVMDIIFDAWRTRGLTVLFVTHNAALAARAQRRLRLADGKVYAV